MFEAPLCLIELFVSSHIERYNTTSTSGFSLSSPRFDSKLMLNEAAWFILEIKELVALTRPKFDNICGLRVFEMLFIVPELSFGMKIAFRVFFPKFIGSH